MTGRISIGRRCGVQIRGLPFAPQGAPRTTSPLVRTYRYATRLFAAALLITTLKAQAFHSNTACAIRWDAWYTNGPIDPARYTAETLSPLQFHGLAPIHGRFGADGKIEWTPSQSTFDAEIRMAHAAGICWAYLMYGKNNVIDLRNPMMRGLAFHRTSTLKAQVRYAMMVTTSLIGRAGIYFDSTNAIVDLLADENYQQVHEETAKRPLLYIYYDAADLQLFFNGSLASMRESIDSIRRTSVVRGLGNPYAVIVLSPANTAEAIRKALAADAITEYVAGSRQGGVEEWATFESSIEADWNSYAIASAGASVPSLRSGADIRARCQTPPPFEHRFPPGFDCAHFYVRNPTLSELATEVLNATAWIKANPTKDPAGLLLLYSWSECDESGNCLMPTYDDPKGTKLHAIASALR